MLNAFKMDLLWAAKLVGLRVFIALAEDSTMVPKPHVVVYNNP